MTEPTKWYTTKQAAEALGITYSTAQTYASRGKFPNAVKVGVQYLIPPKDVRALQRDADRRDAHKAARLYGRMSKKDKAAYDAEQAAESSQEGTEGPAVDGR